MITKSIKYLLVYITPAVVVFSLLSKNSWAYFAIFFVFGLIPFLELFTKGSTKNLEKVEEELIKDDRFYDWLLYLLVPLQYILMLLFLSQVSDPFISPSIKVGMMTAFGVSCGVLGINAAHELGHRATKYEQTMSKALLLTTLYMHFFIEHNRGHHKNVSTDDDPASSKLGESIYAFYFRTIWYSYLSAWKLEKQKLNRSKTPFWSLKNEMIQYHLLQIGLVASIGVTFGWSTLLLFLGSTFIGILLLETVNYIEHYGLRRKKKEKGYERPQPIHSWNSNHPIGRLLLLELSRHSDHHFIASRKYQVLRHFDESPQMPTGYPGMMLLAFVPPLWFRFMNRKIEEYRQTESGKQLA